MDGRNLLARPISPGIGVEIVGIDESVDAIGPEKRHRGAGAHAVIILRRRPGSLRAGIDEAGGEKRRAAD